ncbi:hypothetical protein TNCV_3703791 [Trichonephila clavipes]|nr:hypothetical protein TNCV_3703791 [Trichonephila clavipes]
MDRVSSYFHFTAVAFREFLLPILKMLGFVQDKYNVWKNSTSITLPVSTLVSVTKPFFEEKHASASYHQQQQQGPFPSFSSTASRTVSAILCSQVSLVACSKMWLCL